MRFVLILALLLSSLTMTAPAAATQGASDCHAGMGLSREHDSSPRSEQPVVKAHSCPGCATLDYAVIAAGPKPGNMIPRLIAGASWRGSLLVAPIPPPPRSA